MARALAWLPLVFCAGLAPAVARAQGASNQVAAQALFEDARKMMEAKRFGDACPKFAESQRLDPAPGTQFNLANCYEKNGQTASAWVTFKGAAASYRANGRSDWETRARERSGALEPKLSRLTITLPPENDAPGLEVHRDGVIVGRAELGTAIPIDPGNHIVDATAPGKKKWSTETSVMPSAAKAQTIPKLEEDPNGAKAEATNVKPGEAANGTSPVTGTTTTTTTAAPDGSGQRTIGLVVGGVGLAGLVVGGVTGLIAINKNDQAKTDCPQDGACRSASAVDANSTAKTMAIVSTVAFVAGAVGVGAGAALYLTAPKAKERTAASLRASPAVGPGVAGMTIAGGW